MNSVHLIQCTKKIGQFVNNNDFSVYVISRFSHIHMHTRTHTRLSENLPLVNRETVQWDGPNTKGEIVLTVDQIRPETNVLLPDKYRYITKKLIYPFLFVCYFNKSLPLFSDK